MTRTPVNRRELTSQEGQAVVALLGRGSVARRRASVDRRDVGVLEHQAVTGLDRAGPWRVPGAVQSLEEELARATRIVAGEHATGPIAPVGGGREADEQDPGRWIAESRDRTTPVHRRPMSGHLRPRHLLAPGDEAGAASTGDDVGDEVAEAIPARAVLVGHASGVGVSELPGAGGSSLSGAATPSPTR